MHRVLNQGVTIGKGFPSPSHPYLQVYTNYLQNQINVDLYGKEVVIVGHSVSYDIFDFSYKDSEYPELKGKSFQVLLVEYEPKYMPYLTKKAGDGLKDNTVYVRRGTNSDEATHEELQKIINERIETGYSSKHTLDLEDHLDQLRILDKSVKTGGISAFVRMVAMGEGDSEKGYRQFVAELISRKKSKIEEKLGLK